MFCTNCGKDIGDSKFCATCGTLSEFYKNDDTLKEINDDETDAPKGKKIVSSSGMVIITPEGKKVFSSAEFVVESARKNKAKALSIISSVFKVFMFMGIVFFGIGFLWLEFFGGFIPIVLIFYSFYTIAEAYIVIIAMETAVNKRSAKWIKETNIDVVKTLNMDTEGNTIMSLQLKKLNLLSQKPGFVAFPIISAVISSYNVIYLLTVLFAQFVLSDFIHPLFFALCLIPWLCSVIFNVILKIIYSSIAKRRIAKEENMQNE